MRHYELIQRKNVRCVSDCVMQSAWAAEEETWSPPGFWNFDIFLLNFYKKSFFLGFELVKWNFTSFGPPWKNLFGCRWKNPLFPPSWKNLSDAQGRAIDRIVFSRCVPLSRVAAVVKTALLQCHVHGLTKLSSESLYGRREAEGDHRAWFIR